MDELITIITNHGLSLAIAIIVIYGGIQIMNAYIKYLKKRLNLEKDHDSFAERHKVSTQINLLLNRLMDETNADRISVFEFHNGEGNLGGMPFVKISNTYEVCNKYIASVQKELLNIPCSFFTKFIEKLVAEDYVFLDLNIDNNVNDLADEMQKQHGVSKSVTVLITDINRKKLGFIGLYTYNQEKNITYKEIKKLRDLAKELAVVLTIK